MNCLCECVTVCHSIIWMWHNLDIFVVFPPKLRRDAKLIFIVFNAQPHPENHKHRGFTFTQATDSFPWRTKLSRTCKTVIIIPKTRWMFYFKYFLCVVTSTSSVVVVDDGVTCFYFRFHSVFLTKALLGFSLHVIQFKRLFLVPIASQFSTQFEYVQDQPIEILFLFITFLLKSKKLDNFCHIQHSDGNFPVAGTEMTTNINALITKTIKL